MNGFFRGRRLRKNAAMRALVRETRVTPDDLVMPYFVVESDDKDLDKPIASMPGQSQLGLNALVKRVGQAVEHGLKAVILFGIPANKDGHGTEAYNPDGIVQQAVRALKERYPELIVITDVCLCEYTDHGHCGLLSPGDTAGEVLNDATLELLAREAVSHARAGADMVAPSDMMDGRVAVIRGALDEAGFENVPIFAYSVKYASAFYGPFRDAAESAPSHGDRRTYQMDPANFREAMREAEADMIEGADMLMVKPAVAYLDVIKAVRDAFSLPVGAYHVSGEYSMIKAAAQNGWLDEERVVDETLTAIKRAGADLIITYFTEDFVRRFHER